MRGGLSRTTKSFQIELKLAIQIGVLISYDWRINFVWLNFSHFDFVQIL